MSWLNWFSRKQAVTLSIDEVVRRIEAIMQTSSGITVTPENCMESPTVHAIVTGITRRIISLPVHVFQKSDSDGRTKKEQLPNHPVARLLKTPNEWQSDVEYWEDATSRLLRYGRFIAWKSRGQTGPIRRLIPLMPSAVEILQDDDYNVTYRVTSGDGSQRDYTPREVHYARGPARDGLKGDSPIHDCREAIALEIAAEKFGASFFGGGAMPGIIFKFLEGFIGFRTDEERNKFVNDFQLAYQKRGRFRAMLLPKGIDIGEQVGIENDKAQFLETRKLQRTVIAGAFGVPLYIVGDLEHQTFNNAEQQNLNAVTDVVLPICRIFESAMERDLLTTEDRNSGVIIRFNIDALLRGDFKTRQDGQKIQREAGVICPNDWRENENMNPISKENGGETYWQQGPSGQSGARPAPPGGTPA